MKGYVWSLKYDPDQPRVPSGDPRGGQWTASGRFTDHGFDTDPDDLDRMWEEASKWGGARAEVATTALDVAEEGFRIVSLQNGGELVGVASLSDVDEGPGTEFLGRGYEEIGALATKRAGYGRKAMAEIARSAHSRGHGIFLHAAPEAVGFYRKLGMARSRKAKDYFYLAASAIPQFADRWEAESE